MLATELILFKAGKQEISSAAQAAPASTTVAGNGEGILFTLGVLGGGFLAVPIMTTGAAYHLCEAGDGSRASTQNLEKPGSSAQQSILLSLLRQG